MADFDLSKITGREPPLVTDDERDAEIAYLSDVVANRDRELAALRARVAEAVRMIEGYKRAGLLTNPATAEQATDFISRATGNKAGVLK